MKLFKIGIFIIIVGIITTGILMFGNPFHSTSISENEEAIAIYPAFNGSNLNYNISQVQEEVITEVKSYFGENIDYYGYTIDNQGWDWESSYYAEYDNKAITIGFSGIENREDYYRLVFTHEYTHYLLYRMNVTDDETHEAIADLYTRYTNLEASKEHFGEFNEYRTFPYSIISTKLIEEDREDCLKKVFDKDKKINNKAVLKVKLKAYCNITEEYLTENSVDLTENSDGSINGTINKVMIFDRSLSEDEIKAIYDL